MEEKNKPGESDLKGKFKSASEIGIEHTKKIGDLLIKVLDKAELIDRKLYGKKLKLFIWGSFLVVIIAPFLDWILGIRNDKLTAFSTYFLLIFLIILFLAWISTWRDDNGNWSLKRVIFRLKIYFETLTVFIKQIRTKTEGKIYYQIGMLLIFGGICWKALQNVSVIIRKPLESLLHTRFNGLRSFERFTYAHFYTLILIGIAILCYYCYTDRNLFRELLRDLKDILPFGKDHKQIQDKKIVISDIISNDELIMVNLKDSYQVENLLKTNSSELFNQFILALQKWNPRNCHKEYEFQDRLYNHLKKNIPGASVDEEYPIGSTEKANKGRADIVVNKTLLIEMKRH